MANQADQSVSTQTPASGQGNSMSRARSQREMMGPVMPSPAEFFHNPFGVMRRMHEEMDRVFAQAFSGAGGGLLSQQGNQGMTGGAMTAWSPAIEIRQDNNNLVVCAELPGMKPEEVQVEVNNDALVIQGERR